MNGLVVSMLERQLEESIVQQSGKNRPACESEVHSEGQYGHVPEQPASYLVFPPCGLIYACCAGRVRQYEKDAAIPDKIIIVHCTGCTKGHDTREYTWTEIV